MANEIYMEHIFSVNDIHGQFCWACDDPVNKTYSDGKQAAIITAKSWLTFLEKEKTKYGYNFKQLYSADFLNGITLYLFRLAKRYNLIKAFTEMGVFNPTDYYGFNLEQANKMPGKYITRILKSNYNLFEI